MTIPGRVLCVTIPTDIFPKTYGLPAARGKTLSVTDRRGDAGVPPHTCANEHRQKDLRRVRPEVRVQRSPRALFRGAHPGGNRVEAPHEVKEGAALWPSSPTFASSSEENKNADSERHTHPPQSQ